MIILASAVIISLSNNGIIDRAREAVDKTNTAVEKEKLAELVVGTVNRRGVVDFDALDKLIAEDDTFNGTNGTYIGKATGNVYTVGSYGEVAIKETVKGNWVQEGDDIKFVAENGDVLKTLKIGDEIAYDEGTKGTYTTDASKGTGTSYTSNTLNQGTYTINGENGTVEAGDLNWLVFGVSDDGLLEIISETRTTSKLTLYGKEGYLNAVTENGTLGTLDTFCNNLYGKGTGAISARSVVPEDLFYALEKNSSDYLIERTHTYYYTENGLYNGDYRAGVFYDEGIYAQCDQMTFIEDIIINSENPGPYTVEINYYGGGYPKKDSYSENRWKIIKSFYNEDIVPSGTIYFGWDYMNYCPCWFSCRYICDCSGGDYITYGIGFANDYGSNTGSYGNVFSSSTNSKEIRPIVTLDTDFVLNLD